MNENQMLTEEEVLAVGYEWWCEAGELPRGVNQATEDISRNMKRFFIFLATPYIFMKAFGVFCRGLVRYGPVTAVGMLPIFMRYERKYLEERGWIITS